MDNKDKMRKAWEWIWPKLISAGVFLICSIIVSLIIEKIASIISHL